MARPSLPVAQPVPSSAPRKAKHTSFWRQVAAIAQRQIQLIVADRRYLAFLVLAPIVVGLLPLAVGGDAGFTKPGAGASAPSSRGRSSCCSASPRS